MRFRSIILSGRDLAVRASLTDPLTGLGNRRQMEVGLAILASLADRGDQRLGCLVIDIDHFKSVNDRFGHDVGDRVLRSTAQTLADAIRSGDLIVRLGGEEFAVFALVRDHGELRTMGERLRRAVEHAEGAPAVTVSIGATLAGDEAHGTASALLSISDKALYRAKQSGRNAVEVA
jgi:diguanylate cyclase (GGDEF)-like protein